MENKKIKTAEYVPEQEEKEETGMPLPFEDEEAVAKTHVVQKGDTLATISYQYYGTRKRAGEILKLNDLATPVLRIGRQLILPD